MKKSILILAILSLIASCSKDDDKISSTCQDLLPPITNTGANTFGCCINGNLLTPRDGTGTLGGSDDGYSFFGGYPSGAYNEIEVIDFKSERTAKILIHIQDLQNLGVNTYTIDESNGQNSIDGLNHTYLHCKVFDVTANSYQYYRSFENSGILEITRFEWQNGIISGTFSCVVKNSSNPNDIIEIKDGRFDINGYTLPNVSFP